MQRVGARVRAGREIMVPASIANLGPGFDTLGIAVALYLRVRVAEVVADGCGRLSCHFVDGPLGGPSQLPDLAKRPEQLYLRFRRRPRQDGRAGLAKAAGPGQ